MTRTGYIIKLSGFSPVKSLKTKYGGVPVSTGVCNVCGSEPRPRASLKAGKTITANNELALAA